MTPRVSIMTPLPLMGRKRPPPTVVHRILTRLLRKVALTVSGLSSGADGGGVDTGADEAGAVEAGRGAGAGRWLSCTAFLAAVRDGAFLFDITGGLDEAALEATMCKGAGVAGRASAVACG